MTVLDQPSPRLAHALDETIVAKDERHPVRRGFFGFERGLDGYIADRREKDLWLLRREP